MTSDPTPEDALQKIEASVLSLVLARISLRGRLRVEEDLRQLEEVVGDLPEVRAQLNQLFGVDTAPALPALPALPETEPPPRRGPGRPRKDRDEAAHGGPASAPLPPDRKG